MKLVFDLETSGLPQTPSFGKYYDITDLKKYDSSRVLQVGALLIDEENRPMTCRAWLVKPTFDIAPAAEAVHHISKEKALAEGKDLNDVLDLFYDDLKIVDTLIGHNIKFDYHVLMSECFRAGRYEIVQEMQKKKRYCTMWEGKDYFRLGKVPRLSALYEMLTKTPVAQKHDALDDCLLCLKCYQLLEQGKEERDKRWAELVKGSNSLPSNTGTVQPSPSPQSTSSTSSTSSSTQ